MEKYNYVTIIRRDQHGKAISRIYPLFNFSKLCSHARYVGGHEKYICDCVNPLICDGVIAVAKSKTRSL